MSYRIGSAQMCYLQNHGMVYVARDFKDCPNSHPDMGSDAIYYTQAV